MGRNSTGAWTVGSAFRIEMSILKKMGYFKMNHTTKSSLKWTSGSSISVEVAYYKEESYMTLFYTLKNFQGEEYTLDYKVMIESVPSNLGKGSVLYFICPFTQKKCRILYRAYGSHYFKSREAYKYRLYYDNQISSKFFRPLENYLTANSKLENLCMKKRRNQTTFKGRLTKFILRLNALEKKVEELDYASIEMELWQGKKIIRK